MRRLFPPVLAALAVVAALVVPASAQAPAGTALSLKELDKGSTFGYVDNAPTSKRGFASLGDHFAFSSPLADAAAKRVGRLYGTCTVVEAGTEPRAKFLCYGVFKLPTGTLSGVVLVTGGTTRNGSITGGTGAYANARGVFTEVDRANDDVDVTIALAS